MLRVIDVDGSRAEPLEPAMNRSDFAAPVSRRSFLKGAGAGMAAAVTGLTLTSCAGGRSPGGPTGRSAIKLVTNWLPDVTSAGLWLAFERDYFKNEGVSVEFRTGGPNTPPAVSLVAGRAVDVGEQGNMQAYFDGLKSKDDLVIFGTRYQTNPAGLLSLTKNPVLEPKDLVGKRVLGPSPVDGETVQAILRMNNLPTTIEYIPSGFTPEPLLAGQGDVMVILTTNQPLVLEQKFNMVAERDFHARSYDDFNLPRYSALMFAEGKYITDHHDELVGFVRGLARGWLENERDPSVAAELSVAKYGKDLGLDLRQQIRQNELQIPLLRGPDTEARGLFWVNSERLGGPMYDALRAGGRSDLPAVDTAVTLRILEDADLKSL